MTFRQGTVLFIENIGERPHAVERMMYNLKLGGVLEKLSGLIIGQFTEYEEHVFRQRAVRRIGRFGKRIRLSYMLRISGGTHLR